MDGMLLCIPMVLHSCVLSDNCYTTLCIVTCYKCMCTLLLVWMCGNSGGMGCFKYCYCWWVYCATVKEITPHLQSFMHALWITLLSSPTSPQAITRMTEEVSREQPDKSITMEFMSLDLASLQSVKRFTEEYKQKGLPLHLLINNAGISYNLYG